MNTKKFKCRIVCGKAFHWGKHPTVLWPGCCFCWFSHAQMCWNRQVREDLTGRSALKFEKKNSPKKMSTSELRKRFLLQRDVHVWLLFLTALWGLPPQSFIVVIKQSKQHSAGNSDGKHSSLQSCHYSCCFSSLSRSSARQTSKRQTGCHKICCNHQQQEVFGRNLISVRNSIRGVCVFRPQPDAAE